MISQILFITFAKTSNMETVLNRDEMILALTESQNTGVAGTCIDIMTGKKNPDDVIQYCGSFLRAVLSNDFQEAIDRADKENRLALMIAVRKKELRIRPKYRNHEK